MMGSSRTLVRWQKNNSRTMFDDFIEPNKFVTKNFKAQRLTVFKHIIGDDPSSCIDHQ